MDRLEAMTILLSAADKGSLSAASRHLRIPLATVSRRVSELEEHLNVRLLLRGNRKLVLTDSGRAYVASCRRVVEEIAEIERAASGEYRAPQGEMFISAPLILGRVHIAPVVVAFLDAFPQIRVHLELSDRRVNMLEEHIDLAVRVGELEDSSMIATRVGLVRQVLCASPSYLEKRGVPQKPQDLAEHDCVAYESQAGWSSWNLREDGAATASVEIRSRLVVNSGEAAVVAAASGAGIARVLSYQIDDLIKSHALVRVLEQYEPLPMPVSLVYASQRQMPLKLRAFLDFSIASLKQRLM